MKTFDVGFLFAAFRCLVCEQFLNVTETVMAALAAEFGAVPPVDVFPVVGCQRNMLLPEAEETKC